jgi:O-antigen ligase
MQLFSKVFKIPFLVIFLAELFSLFGYLLPTYNTVCFLVIVTLTLILSLYKFEYGLWILLAELFIGSKGYLFYFEYGGLVISIRMALWLIIMSVWLTNFIIGLMKKKEAKLPVGNLASYSFLPYFLILFIFIAWGLVSGFLNHNSFNNIFFDFNGWLYFTLIFPIYSIIKNNKHFDTTKYHSEQTAQKQQFNTTKHQSEAQSIYSPINNILQIFTAAIIWLSVKTFFLLFAFSHNMTGIIYELYRWVRTSGIGEITQIQGGFYRIFFQSHIFVLVGFFIFFMLLLSKNRKLRFQTGNWIFSRTITSYFLLLTSFLSVILISFSRSNWVGLVIGLLLYGFIVLWLYNWKQLLKISGVLIISLILSVAFIVAVVKFPYPAPVGGFATTQLLSERAIQLSGEAAVSSRWALLPAVWAKIKKAPIAGLGFGTTVTYNTSDPRIRQTNLTGQYTTYAFEWGWLDIWLKLGLLGLLAYLVLLGKICITGIASLRLLGQNGNEKYKIISGLAIGLAVVAVVSIFSPYMNHPLGIGYLLMVSAIIETYHS